MLTSGFVLVNGIVFSSSNGLIIQCLMGSIIPESQNRVMHYDVTKWVTNSKFFFLILRVNNSLWKKL